MDLRELIEGTTLFVPVFHTGGKLWTSDSHAAQGDGEVNLTAIETAMRKVRIQYVLHKQVGLPGRWSSRRRTGSAWGWTRTWTKRPDLVAPDDPVSRRRGWGVDRLDAYSLCSIAVTFRITQSVDGHKGVHGMLPKDLFRADLRARLGDRDAARSDKGTSGLAHGRPGSGQDQARPSSAPTPPVWCPMGAASGAPTGPGGNRAGRSRPGARPRAGRRSGRAQQAAPLRDGQMALTGQGESARPVG